jgi:hypothetical protein
MIDIILGYPFFEGVNPDIDWPTGTLAQKVTLFNHDEWKQHMDKLETSWVYANTQKTTIAQQLAEKNVNKRANLAGTSPTKIPQSWKSVFQTSI